MVLPLCEVELRGHWAQLCIGGRVEAVGGCRPGSERCCCLAVALFLGESRDLAVLNLALDDDKRVDVLDRLAIFGCEAEHVVEHNGAVRQRLGRDEQALTKCALRERCKKLGKLGLDAVGSNHYVARGEGEDGLVGKDGEALIAWCGRCVELCDGTEQALSVKEHAMTTTTDCDDTYLVEQVEKVSFVVLGLALWEQLGVLGCKTGGVEASVGRVEHTWRDLVTTTR